MPLSEAIMKQNIITERLCSLVMYAAGARMCMGEEDWSLPVQGSCVLLLSSLPSRADWLSLFRWVAGTI